MMDDDIRPTGATPTTPQVPGAAIATMLARHEIRRAERIAAQEPVPDDQQWRAHISGIVSSILLLMCGR